MKLTSVQNIKKQNLSFKAHTKKGNEYYKSHAGLAGSVIASTLYGTVNLAANVARGNVATKAIGKHAGIIGAAAAISAVFGAAVDFVFNRIRAIYADKHPMTLEQKFERDLNSKKFSMFYDSNSDETILINKKQADKYQNIDADRRKLDNIYSLKDNGSVTIVDGRDRVISTTKQENKNKLQMLGKAKTIIQDNEVVKKLVNETKISKLFAAQNDENYKYSYDKENDIVTLSRTPEKTSSGTSFYESFNFRPDGTITLVTKDKEAERPIRNVGGTSYFDAFADVKTDTRKFFKALADKENYTMYFDSDEHSLILTKKENLEGENKDKFAPRYEINNLGMAFYRYLEFGDTFSPNSYVVMNSSDSLKEMYEEYEKKATENQ